MTAVDPNQPSLGRVVQLRQRSGPWQTSAHPRGEAGIRKAMAWMCERIASDARNPLVVAWTRETIAQAQLPDPRGYPNPDNIVRAVFARFKRETIFVRDPVDTEWIGNTVQVLALDPDDLQLHGGDCDDLIRAVASCILSVGIPVRLDLRFYPKQNQAHIVVNYDSDPALKGLWSCLDPSVESGACSVQPYQGQILMEVVMGTQDRPGVFVGMQGPPLEAGTMGDPPTDLSGSDVQGWVDVVGYIKAQLDTSIAQLAAVNAGYAAVRSALGLSDYDTAPALTTPFELQPPGGATTGTGPLATYWTSHQWTSAAAAAETQMVQAAQFASTCLADALAGTRAMYWNQSDVLIASKTGDPFRLAIVNDASGNPTIQYLDPSTGASTGTMGLGVLDILIGGAVVVAVTAAVSWAVVHYMDKQRTEKTMDALTRIADQQQANVQAGIATPADAAKVLQAATGFAAAAQPSTPPPSLGLAGGIAVAALGAVAGGAAVYFGGRWLGSFGAAA